MNDRQFYRTEMGRDPELDKKLTKEEEKRIVDKFAVQEIKNRATRQQILLDRINKEYEKAVCSSVPHHLDLMSVSSVPSSSCTVRSVSSLLNRSSLDSFQKAISVILLKI